MGGTKYLKHIRNEGNMTILYSTEIYDEKEVRTGKIKTILLPEICCGVKIQVSDYLLENSKQLYLKSYCNFHMGSIRNVWKYFGTNGSLRVKQKDNICKYCKK